MNCQPDFVVPEGYELRQGNVRVQQLDDALRSVRSIGVIKMDIEGHEIFAVLGGQRCAPLLCVIVPPLVCACLAFAALASVA